MTGKEINGVTHITIKVNYNDQQMSSIIRVPEADFFSAMHDLIRLTHQGFFTGYELKKNVDRYAEYDYLLKVFFDK